MNTLFKQKVNVVINNRIFLSLLIISLPWSYSKQLVRAQDGYFFFFQIFLLILIFVYAVRLIWDKSIPIVFTKVDFLFLFYIFYVVLISLFRKVRLPIDTILESAGLIFLYFILRSLKKDTIPILLASVILGSIGQAVYGNLQLYGFYLSNHNLFKMTGSFFNPGPYAGYLVSALPVAIVIYIFYNHKGHEERHKEYKVDTKNSLKNFGERGLQYIALVAIVAIILVLPASKSRAAWLAAIVSGGYILFQMVPNGFSKGVLSDRLFKKNETRSVKQGGTNWNGLKLLDSPLKKKYCNINCCFRVYWWALGTVQDEKRLCRWQAADLESNCPNDRR